MRVAVGLCDLSFTEPTGTPVMPAQVNMSQAYVIEVRDRTAGIVARDANGFRFHSSERTFDTLQGRFFRSPQAAERAVRAIVDRARRDNAPLVFA
jgi:hypothetical protein